MPAAWEITVRETLGLLDTDLPGVAEGVAQARYALWLGSGISLNRVVGVPAVIGRVIEYLRSRMDPADPACRHKVALDRVIERLSMPERQRLHLDQPIGNWPEEDRRIVTCRLAEAYAEVLETPLDEEAEADFLLWQAVDVQDCFTGDQPDAEHLCIVMLTLEGAFHDISSANWDYLLEAAERDLTGAVGNTIDVCILATDFQNAGARAKLLKYHGCAVRAVAEPGTYRDLLIARTPQIQQYRNNQAYQVMRTHLVSLVQERRTLMIGFSAQDSDVQEVFVDGAPASNWNWADNPKAFLFAEDMLKSGQRTVLSTAYGADYPANRNAIEGAARVRAYAKPLLTALLLSVLEQKAAAFAELGLPAAWAPAERAVVIEGLRHLRDEVAALADPDRHLLFVQTLIAALNLGLDLYHHGSIDHGRYIPLSAGPVQHVGTIPMVTGLRQASVALAMLGKGAANGDWSLACDPTAAIPVRLTQDGRMVRLFFAANDDVANHMIQNGHVDLDSDDSLLLLSTSAKASVARSPASRYGRGSKAGLREVCMRSVITGAADAAEMMTSFKWSAAL